MRSISASVGDQNGTSHGPLWGAARAAAVQPTRLGHPRFLDAVGAQPADFNEVRSPKKPGHTWPHAVEFPIRIRNPTAQNYYGSYSESHKAAEQSPNKPLGQANDGHGVDLVVGQVRQPLGQWLASFGTCHLKQPVAQ